jgi:hypothetical protein
LPVSLDSFTFQSPMNLIILPFIVHGCETCFSPKGKKRLRAVDKKVLKEYVLTWGGGEVTRLEKNV